MLSFENCSLNTWSKIVFLHLKPDLNFFSVTPIVTEQ